MNSGPLLDEENIIRNCLDGDAESYSILVNRYKTMIYNVAFRMVADEDTAKDLAQESFIAAYKGLRQFRFGSKFSSWLYSIALNKCRDYLKMAKNLVSTDELPDMDLLSGSETSPERAAAEAQDKDILQQALDALPLEYRQVLILKHIEELDYQEIADITGTSVAALKVRAHRGREMLKKILEEARVNHG